MVPRPGTEKTEMQKSLRCDGVEPTIVHKGQDTISKLNEEYLQAL